MEFGKACIPYHLDEMRKTHKMLVGTPGRKIYKLKRTIKLKCILKVEGLKS
jgi:hypothetical protein